MDRGPGRVRYFLFHVPWCAAALLAAALMADFFTLPAYSRSRRSMAAAVRDAWWCGRTSCYHGFDDVGIVQRAGSPDFEVVADVEWSWTGPDATSRPLMVSLDSGNVREGPWALSSRTTWYSAAITPLREGDRATREDLTAIAAALDRGQPEPGYISSARIESAIAAIRQVLQAGGGAVDLGPGSPGTLLVTGVSPTSCRASRTDPIWSGYLHNTLAAGIAASLLWLLSFGGAIRSLRAALARPFRLARGLCPMCAYPRAGLPSDTCPECGGPLPLLSAACRGST